MTTYTGKVKYINKEKHYGFVALSGHKDIIFYMNNGKNLFSLGDIVDFEITTITNKNGDPYETATSMRLHPENPQADTSDTAKNTASDAGHTPDDAANKKPLKYFTDRSLAAPIRSALEHTTGESCSLMFLNINLDVNCNLYEAGLQWMLGQPECMIRLGGKICHAKVRTETLYDKTIHGSNVTMQDLHEKDGVKNISVPAYGCPSFFMNKDLCANSIEFARRAGIDQEFFYIIFIDHDKTNVYTLSLKKLQQLMDFGYQHTPLGEYPSKPNFKGICSSRYLLPAGAFDVYPVPQAENKAE